MAHNIPRARRVLSWTMVAMVLALCGAELASGHHSGAMFDRDRTIPIEGVVREFLWTNPHASVKVEVAGSKGSEPVIWGIEMNGPNNLVHEGWKRTSLHNGDKVTFWINPLRGGQPGGWYVGVQLADGQKLGTTGKGTSPRD